MVRNFGLIKITLTNVGTQNIISPITEFKLLNNRNLDK